MYQPPLTIDRGEKPNTAIGFSLTGMAACAAAIFAYRRWGTIDELGELFLAVAVFGAVFFLIGLSLLLWRSQVILDRDAGTGLQWNGILVPMKRSVFRLDEVRQVTLSRARIRGRYSTTIVYSARLEGPAKAVVLVSDQNESAVRQVAEDVARYLGSPLADEISQGRA